MRAACVVSTPLSVEAGSDSSPALSALQYAALVHPVAEVRECALEHLDPFVLAAIADVLIPALGVGAFSPEATEKCLRAIASSNLATLRLVLDACGRFDAKDGDGTGPAMVCLKREIALHLPWERHYAGPRGRAGARTVTPDTAVNRSGVELARCETSAIPALGPLWREWFDALREGDGRAHAVLDRLAGVFLAYPMLPETADLARDLFLAVQGAGIRGQPAAEASPLYAALAVAALREPAILVCPALSRSVRLAVLDAMRALYPRGALLRPAEPQRRSAMLPCRLSHTGLQLERFLLGAFARLSLPESSECSRGSLDCPRAILGMVGGPDGSLSGLRAAGLPLCPGGGRIFPEDLPLWLEPAGATNCSGGTLLEAWLALMPREHHAHLVWRHAEEQVVVGLAAASAADAIAEQIMSGEGEAARHVMRLRQPHPLSLNRVQGRLQRGPIRQAMENALRCGHRQDLAALFEEPSLLDPLVELLPCVEPLALPARRREYVEFAGRLLAGQLRRHDAVTTGRIQHLVSRFDPSQGSFGVVFHTLEALGRTQPDRLAALVVEHLRERSFGGAGSLAGWAGMDTLGDAFHEAVAARLGADCRERWRELRLVRMPPDGGPLPVAVALHRLATGRSLPVARVRENIAGWIGRDLLAVSLPVPDHTAARVAVGGLALVLLAALRDRIDGHRAGLVGNTREWRSLRVEVDAHVDALVLGTERERSAERVAEGGAILAEAARWAARLGRTLGRGRRVRLLGTAGGRTTVGVSEAARMLRMPARPDRCGSALGDVFLPLAVHRLLLAGEDWVSPRGPWDEPALTDALLNAVSRAPLPVFDPVDGSQSRERLRRLLPASRRAEAWGAVPPAVFWELATAPSAEERERLLEHIRVAAGGRLVALADAVPWWASELPDAGIAAALLAARDSDPAVIDALEGGLRRMCVGARSRNRRNPTSTRLAASLAFVDALPVPIRRRQRWQFHLLRQDTRALVASLLAPDTMRLPAGVETMQQWQEERAACMACLPYVLGLPLATARIAIGAVLLRAGSWAEWCVLAGRCQPVPDGAWQSSMIDRFAPSWRVRLPSRPASGHRGVMRALEARKEQERARVGALRVFMEGLLDRADAASDESVARDTDEGVVRAAGMLLRFTAPTDIEAQELLAVLIRRSSADTGRRVVRLLAACRSDLVLREPVFDALISRASTCHGALTSEVLDLVRAVPDAELQRIAVRALLPREERLRILRRLAELSRWTAVLGRRLTGVPTRVRFVGGDELGFTRLDGHTIWVNPVAWLEQARDGRAIVEGLITHEIGHLAMHTSQRFREIVAEAARRGVHHKRWLNIVLDEHLERNLRARDARRGDSLKKLCAWSLLHRARRIPVSTILRQTGLRGLAGGVRTHHLDALPDMLCVSGRELVPPADPGERFFRGLRLGLGTRTKGTDMDRAHRMFREHFRHLGPDALGERAEELARLFPGIDETGQGAVSACAAGEPAPGDPRDTMLLGGWTVVEIDDAAAVGEREPSARSGAEQVVVHNRQSSLHVRPFAACEVPPVDRAAEAALRRRVRALAGPVHEALAQLGRRRVVERHRLKGRRLERDGLGRRVIVSDPRLLRRIRRVNHGDLFIGIAVDSSGSMRMLNNIDKARTFAAITAVAADGLPHVTTRICGFTDRILLDLGDARRTRLTALRARGGNNDAAALDWIAEQAVASRRRHRLLVMISDGRPTACSDAALASRVAFWERSGMMLVQLALREIDPPLFPQQVTLAARSAREATAEWCRLIADLATTCAAGSVGHACHRVPPHRVAVSRTDNDSGRTDGFQ